MGLPVYSASGFDLLGILARIASRPAPKIQLGPVDMTCAFVVSDTRRYDSPIVYASPTFCALTGYTEHELLGRNCRFLQAPDGRVAKGEEQRYTAPDAVGLLRKCLSADKECQTSLAIVNYKKGGQAFIDLVTVILVPGGPADAPEDRERAIYHVGFQVDLTQQPNAILQRLKDGSYIVNYSSAALAREADRARLAPVVRNPLPPPPPLPPGVAEALARRRPSAPDVGADAALAMRRRTSARTSSRSGGGRRSRTRRRTRSRCRRRRSRTWRRTRARSRRPGARRSRTRRRTRSPRASA
jgi:hypothetical protein